MFLYCPKCRGEYLDGILVCKKCNKDLIRFEELPPILPFCPSCKTRYPVGTAVCNKCLTELISEIQEEIPKKEPNPIAENVTIYETSSLTELALIKSALENQNIQFNARGEDVQNLFAAGLTGGYNPVTGGIKIDVEKSNVKKAIEIIEPIIEPENE